MANSVAIGTPQYGGKKKQNFRLKEGDNVYRILPPLGELASLGTWAVYECVHWGYKGSKGFRPFRCIKKTNRKTKMVIQACPECDKIADKKASLEDTEKRLQAEGKSKEAIKEFVKPLADWLFSHNLDKKWNVNALSPEDLIGKLGIPHKMFTQLQVVIEKLVKEGMDPVGVENGVWFNLVRTGTGNQTTHTVTVVDMEETINGRKMRTYKPAPLTTEILGRLGTEAFDLKNTVASLSYDEILAIVSSGGDPDVVDSVFSNGEVKSNTTTNAATATVAEDDEPEEPTATANVYTANVAIRPEPTPVAQPAAIRTVLDVKSENPENELIAMKAKMAELQKQLALAKTPVKPEATPTTSPSTVSDEDFINQFGFKTTK